MFTLSIVTPEKVFFEGQIDSLSVPGTEGYLGVLSHHAPLITALKPGLIEFRDDQSDVRLMAVSGGFLEVSDNTATLLADAVEFTDQIDLERAEAAFKRAGESLIAARAGAGEIDVAEAEAAVERAANRMKIYRDSH